MEIIWVVGVGIIDINIVYGGLASCKKVWLGQWACIGRQATKANTHYTKHLLPVHNTICDINTYNHVHLPTY